MLTPEGRSRNILFEMEHLKYSERHITFNHYNVKTIMIINLDKFNMSKLQKKRLEFLSDHMYDVEENTLRIKVKEHLEEEQNQVRAFEIFYELMLESLRAPL